MPLPFVGALVGGALNVGKKLIGKALSRATKGKLIGSGGGRELVRRATQLVGGTAAATATTVAVNRIANRAPVSRYEELSEAEQRVANGGFRQRYRRMNPMNHRALRRAVRRLEGAEKLFRKVFTISGGKITPKKRSRR